MPVTMPLQFEDENSELTEIDPEPDHSKANGSIIAMHVRSSSKPGSLTNRPIMEPAQGDGTGM